MNQDTISLIQNNKELADAASYEDGILTLDQGKVSGYLKQEVKDTQLSKAALLGSELNEEILRKNTYTADDYIDKNLLEKLNDILKEKEYDLIKFKINLVDEEGKLIRKEFGIQASKEVSIKEMFEQEFCEPAWTYCYNFNFWNKNKFKYEKRMIHEDFGLTPQIIMTSNNIYYLNYYGYNYVQRKHSIMSEKSLEKDLKKAYDMLKQFDRLINVKYKNNDYLNVYKSFLANAVISKSNTLSGKEKKLYIKKLKERKVFDLLITDTLVRKIKKIIFKLIYRS